MLNGPVHSNQEETSVDVAGNSVTESPNDFPTLIPYTTASDSFDDLEVATEPSPKIRSEGRITSETALDSIRDWRKRLYKAFKNRSKISRIIRKSPTDEAVEMNDVTPTIMDKNRQIILSRTEPNWQPLVATKPIQTYGRDSNGKLVPLFGIEPAALLPQTPIEPYPPREIRFAYRTSNRQPVVYVPATPQTLDTVPVPVASYLVTATPPQQPIQLHILPPIPTPRELPQQFVFQTTSAPPAFSYSTFAPQKLGENFETTSNQNGGCNGQCNGAEGQGMPESDDEKCNSQRLRNIIFSHIVNGDAEASKRAVQSAAEAETGLFFDAICGTGFFSYIAHTDEFCLASSGGVNCYVFSPVCQNESVTRKMKKKTLLSTN